MSLSGEGYRADCARILMASWLLQTLLNRIGVGPVKLLAVSKTLSKNLCKNKCNWVIDLNITLAFLISLQSPFKDVN